MDDDLRKFYEEDLAAGERDRRGSRRAAIGVALGAAALLVVPLAACTAWGWVDLTLRYQARGYDHVRVVPSGLLTYAVDAENPVEACSWGVNWDPGGYSAFGGCSKKHPPIPAWMRDGAERAPPAPTPP